MSKVNPWKVTGYKPGQNVVCKVVGPEDDGYVVHVTKDNLAGYIRTPAPLRPGEEILAQFVCVHKNRLLLSPLMSSNIDKGASLSRSSSVNWQEQLEDIQNTQTQAQTQGYGAAQTQSQTGTHQIPVQDNNYQQYSAPQDPSQWQDSVAKERTPTKHFRLRRAIDLIMPPVDQEGRDNMMQINMAENDIEWITMHVEGGMMTGCIKLTSEERLSRSDALLYRGKVVGCIYGCKHDPEVKPTEDSLVKMVNDLDAQDAQVLLYDLPESVTLAMSALFIGVSVEPEYQADSLTYFNNVMQQFINDGRTACVVITSQTTQSNYLVFVHNRQFAGAFFVDEQSFTTDPDRVMSIFQVENGVDIQANMLSPDLLAPGTRFGYSLGMSRNKKTGF